MHVVIPGPDGVPHVYEFARSAGIRELGLLSEAIDSLPSVMSDEQFPLLVRHAALQAFLIDVRALVGFLGPPPSNRRKDDQFARDWSDQKWTPADEAAVSGALQSVVDEINKQLAHMTTPRIGDGNAHFATDVNFTDERIREIATQAVEFYNRFADVASIERVGARRPWHNDDGSLATVADMRERFPDAHKTRRFRVTGGAAFGNTDAASGDPDPRVADDPY